MQWGSGFLEQRGKLFGKSKQKWSELGYLGYWNKAEQPGEALVLGSGLELAVTTCKDGMLLHLAR